MRVIKRSGAEADFSREKIHKAITRANDEVKAENKKYAASDETIDLIATRLYERCRKRPKATPVEEIKDMIVFTQDFPSIHNKRVNLTHVIHKV